MGIRGKKNSGHSATTTESADRQQAPRRRSSHAAAKLKRLTTIRLASAHMPAQVASMETVIQRLADDFGHGDALDAGQNASKQSSNTKTDARNATPHKATPKRKPFELAPSTSVGANG